MFAKRSRLNETLLALGLTSLLGTAMAAPTPTEQQDKKSHAAEILGGDAKYAAAHQPQMSSQRPSGFDAPVYSNNLIDSKYMEAAPNPSGVSTKSAIFKTKDAPLVVNQWYQSALKSTGWEIEAPRTPSQPNPLQQAGNLFMTRAHKNGSSLMFYCVRTKGTDYTRINVSVLPTPPGAR